MVIANRRRTQSKIVSPFLFILLPSLIILVVAANPSQLANRRSIGKETRIQGDVNVEEEAKMDSAEHKGHKDCNGKREGDENKENTGSVEIDLGESGLKREQKNGLERVESIKKEEKRGNGRRNSELLAKALMDDEGTKTSEKPPMESTTTMLELTTSNEQQEGKAATIQAALEFDTFAPGFFPSSPGFSDEENNKSSTEASNFEENGKKREEIVLLDSTNGTTIGEGLEEGDAKNGSRFWEFERVKIENETFQSTQGIELTTENGTISADISRNNETSEADDAEIIGTTEAAILDRDIEQLTTPFEGDETKKGKKKLGKRPDIAFFPGANSTEIGCDDESHSHESAAEIMPPKSQKNATKLLKTKHTETEFFAGVDELNDDKENRVADEVEELRVVENSEWGMAKGKQPKALPELAVEIIGINGTKEAIELVVDRAVTTRTTLATEERTTTTTTLSTTPIKWTPYTFDCANEVDDRGELLCQEWAKGGLCEINKATRFLFCRRTCLCIGFQ